MKLWNRLWSTEPGRVLLTVWAALVLGTALAVGISRLAMMLEASSGEPAPSRRVPLEVQENGAPSTLRAPATLSVPILAWYDPATKTVSVTEQGRLAGVRCVP